MFTGERLAGEFHIPLAFDVLALTLFAITGALSAAKRDYDWIGVLAIALVTGAGGGLIRDVLLNIRPALLENEPYLWAVLLAVFLSVYFCGYLARVRWVFTVADALGLAMYAVIGTQKSLDHGLGITAAVLIGTLNAIGGGMIRDILTQQEVSLLKPGQWYASIAFGASIVFASLTKTGYLPGAIAGVMVVLAAFLCRIYAQRYDKHTKVLRPRGYDSSNW